MSTGWDITKVTLCSKLDRDAKHLELGSYLHRTKWKKSAPWKQRKDFRPGFVFSFIFFLAAVKISGLASLGPSKSACGWFEVRASATNADRSPSSLGRKNESVLNKRSSEAKGTEKKYSDTPSHSFRTRLTHTSMTFAQRSPSSSPAS